METDRFLVDDWMEAKGWTWEGMAGKKDLHGVNPEPHKIYATTESDYNTDYKNLWSIKPK